ncbi:MAG: DUF4465 domain-containing protein, partial [Saprospiraceae bacterium]|nr:DUF4465 domain-containing protein [Saprospiraceae bacterium]
EYVDDPNFPYWNGWAVSATTDTSTPGFGNQYSCISGSGVNGSNTYALGYVYGSLQMNLAGSANGGVVNGLYVNNSTYAYLSMLEGDAFAKKFGGENGTDPDFFKLTIRKSLNGVEGTDSVEFYLADYRFTDNSQDYIVNNWTWIDLSELGPADLLSFSLSSSDVGAFGINTPTYFCVDNVETADTPTATASTLNPNLKVWPNPTTDFLKIDWPKNTTATAWLSNVYGERICSFALQPGQNSLAVSDLPAGVFTLQTAYNGGMISQTLIKH